jgi:hypothetical protein
VQPSRDSSWPTLGSLLSLCHLCSDVSRSGCCGCCPRGGGAATGNWIGRGTAISVSALHCPAAEVRQAQRIDPTDRGAAGRVGQRRAVQQESAHHLRIASNDEEADCAGRRRKQPRRWCPPGLYSSYRQREVQKRGRGPISRLRPGKNAGRFWQDLYFCKSAAGTGSGLSGSLRRVTT